MDQIIITHKDGTTLPLMRRAAVSAVTKAQQKKVFAGADTVTLTVQSALPLNFQLGDKIRAFSGETYTLNSLAPVKKTGSRRFEYTLTFEGRQYELIDAQWLLPDGLMLDSYTGTLAQFAAILINNANRRQPGRWVLGTVPAQSDYKTLTYSGKNCLEVLWDLCSQYGVESEIIEDAEQGTLTLHFRTVGQVFPYTFKYGRGGGLYNLERKAISGTNVITRLYVYGGNKNLPLGYRYNRLCLPSCQKNESYIEDADAVARYGIREGRKEYNEIFPQRYGEITSLGGDVLSFVDNTMDSDLNERDQQGNTKWLKDGISAKVQFTTGQLAGYSFELQSYDHSTKTIRIKAFQDESGYYFPDAASAARQFAVGDKYFFTDIQLPQSYVTAAETATQTAGTADYNKTKAPQASYALQLEKLFLSQFATPGTEAALFQPGDYLTVQDDDLGANRNIRIQELTRDLLDPYKYTVTLADTTATASSLVRTIADVDDIKDIIEINQLNDPQKARRNWRATQDVLSAVFDPEGHYYSEKIRPLSIETTMLAVGAKSQQFTLAGVTFEPNHNGDPNAIASSAGTLVHFAIDANIRSWALAAVSVSNLTPATIYYVYARCARTGTAGNIVIDSTQRQADSDTTYYYFLIGTLSSVITDSGGTRGARVLSLTYGSSTINGRFISTGRIQSSGGSPTYFDLDNGEIGGKIKFTASDGTLKNVADLDDKADEAKDYINNTLPGILSDIQAQLDGQIEQFFETYDPTTSNLPASGWSAADKEAHLGDLFYNTSSGKVFRWVKENGVYKWQELSDAELAQALQLANDALALAMQKRRIFTTTPTPPYDVGDLWVQGPNGGIYRCKTARATGSYNSADWEEASNYTDDTALQNFITGQFATVTADLTNQIDGKIETWFTDTDPATAWTTAALKAKHVGDMWYSATAKQLKRYCVNGSTYSWQIVEDTTALAAYAAAAQAQDTADGKRQVFVATPTTPYDIGDLWLKTDGTQKLIFRCFHARTAEESYIASDWDEAVTYDNTKTVIDGGIVTSGTVQLAGDDQHIKAGITGEGTADTSVRIWAGATKPNRASAPFRVLQNGKVVATNAEITGKITASEGSIGGWNILQALLKSIAEASAGVPAISLDGTNGQIKMGASLVLDKESLQLLYNDYARLLVKNVTVGKYSPYLLAASYSKNNTDTKVYPATYWPTSGVSYNYTGINPIERIDLGYFEVGSSITLTSFALSFTVPYLQQSTNRVRLESVNFKATLYKDGVAVATKSTTGGEMFYSGESVSKTLSFNTTYRVTGTGGYYHIVVEPVNGAWLMTNIDSGGQVSSFNANFTQKWSFTRGNYERTLLGRDGFIATWGSGYIFFSGEAFVVRFGDYMLKIDTTGIKKSTNGGSSWTSL